MVYPAQICKMIAENTFGTKKIYHTSPTSFLRVNAAAKNLYGVQKMNGREVHTFANIGDAISYANSVNTDNTIVRIAIRPYGNRYYCPLADICR